MCYFWSVVAAGVSAELPTRYTSLLVSTSYWACNMAQTKVLGLWSRSIWQFHGDWISIFNDVLYIVEIACGRRVSIRRQGSRGVQSCDWQPHIQWSGPTICNPNYIMRSFIWFTQKFCIYAIARCHRTISWTVLVLSQVGMYYTCMCMTGVAILLCHCVFLQVPFSDWFTVWSVIGTRVIVVLEAELFVGVKDGIPNFSLGISHLVCRMLYDNGSSILAGLAVDCSQST